MKKRVVSLVLMLAMVCSASAKNYYVSFSKGDDKKNSGLTPDAPLKTLWAASKVKLQGGDSLLFAGGDRFVGSLVLEGIRNRKGGDIVVSSYGEGRATIDGRGNLAAIQIMDCSNITIEKINVTGDGGGFKVASDKGLKMRCGVLVRTSEGASVSKGITLRDLYAHDIYYNEPGHVVTHKESLTANGTLGYGYGIRVIPKGGQMPSGGFEDVKIENCVVERVSHTGIKCSASAASPIVGLIVSGCRVEDVGGPGMQFAGVDGAHIVNTIVNRSGSISESRNWKRGSGMWTWGCNDFLIEHNRFTNANGPADSAGCHIDFNCSNIIVQYNLSANNAGGFCEILGNNHNCSYRYNVSVNDGARIKKKGVASQEGKVFWLSGFVGKDKKRNGPYNSYFYNNTVYTNADVVAKMAVENTTEGICFVNNIFYLEGEVRNVQGDQYRAESGAAKVVNPLFKNNIFLNESNWPATIAMQDEAPIYGDPQFVNAGTLEIADYTPQNKALVAGKGIAIPQLSGDKVGLKGGLKMDVDILGNKVGAKPSMGAIEIK